MTRPTLALILAALTLAACGADGPPVPPAAREPKAEGAITISGQARAGVTASN